VDLRPAAHSRSERVPAHDASLATVDARYGRDPIGTLTAVRLSRSTTVVVAM
jgi:hypothetical protein